MKTLIYTGSLGPARIVCGTAGAFDKDIPQQIDDDSIAAALLAKGCFTEAETAPAPKATKAPADKPE